MSCFEIPKGILRELEGMMVNFFWQGGRAQKVHWITWKRLCRSKRDGGLGFRRLKEFNMAMLEKQAWKVAVNPQSLLQSSPTAEIFPQLFLHGGRRSEIILTHLAIVDSCEGFNSSRDKMANSER
ncbi:UNVERIFIED_CONTAM: hypothetical protein Sradi_3965500 [Sesamum radiatum]|uniref:Uncharacterized protein n=1 Tax=Sesamum radiatum TaxID=300843 RepID=A0AAW2PI26_SESRA